ncbi:MAG: NIPSNAP family protein, partial [Pseudoxanthomonas sp.]
ICTYNLKPGARERFARIASEEVMPMLARWGTDVVRHGPSAHDEDTYFLIRAYASLDDRQQRQDAFYGSDEWVHGPRASILGLIENFTSLVVELDASTLAGLRDEVEQA